LPLPRLIADFAIYAFLRCRCLMPMLSADISLSFDVSFVCASAMSVYFSLMPMRG